MEHQPTGDLAAVRGAFCRDRDRLNPRKADAPLAVLGVLVAVAPYVPTTLVDAEATARRATRR